MICAPIRARRRHSRRPRDGETFSTGLNEVRTRGDNQRDTPSRGQRSAVVVPPVASTGSNLANDGHAGDTITKSAGRARTARPETRGAATGLGGLRNVDAMKAHPNSGETKAVAVGDARMTGDNLGGRGVRREKEGHEVRYRDKRAEKKKSHKRQRHRRSLDDPTGEREARPELTAAGNRQRRQRVKMSDEHRCINHNTSVWAAPRSRASGAATQPTGGMTTDNASSGRGNTSAHTRRRHQARHPSPRRIANSKPQTERTPKQRPARGRHPVPKRKEGTANDDEQNRRTL